jgi:hypothetical protein
MTIEALIAALIVVAYLEAGRSYVRALVARLSRIDPFGHFAWTVDLRLRQRAARALVRLIVIVGWPLFGTLFAVGAARYHLRSR